VACGFEDGRVHSGLNRIETSCRWGKSTWRLANVNVL